MSVYVIQIQGKDVIDWGDFSSAQAAVDYWRGIYELPADFGPDYLYQFRLSIEDTEIRHTERGEELWLKNPISDAPNAQCWMRCEDAIAVRRP